MKTLYILRGAPGSGKSTYAKTFRPHPVFEADQFMLENGEYIFHKEKLFQAHKMCQEAVENALINEGQETVVVANTFTKRWEVKPYLEIAKEACASVVIIHIIGNHKNVHGVPEDVVQRMKDNYQPFPKERVMHS